MQSPQQQAQAGLRQIEQAIINLLEQHPDGLTNAEIAKSLGIETGDPGEHRNMLSWSIIGRLVRASRIDRVRVNRKVLLRLKGD